MDRTNQYKKNHYHRVPLDLTFETYDKLKAIADREEKSVNAFLKDLIQKRIEQE